MFKQLNEAFFKRFGKYLKLIRNSQTNIITTVRYDDEPFSATESRFIAGFEAGWEARGKELGWSK